MLTASHLWHIFLFSNPNVRLEPPDRGFSWESFPGSSSNPQNAFPQTANQPFPPPPDLQERKPANPGQYFEIMSQWKCRNGDNLSISAPLTVCAISCIFPPNLFQFPSWKRSACFPKINCSWGRICPQEWISTSLLSSLTNKEYSVDENHLLFSGYNSNYSRILFQHWQEGATTQSAAKTTLA